MNSFCRYGVGAALAFIAVPALAQSVSDSYTFLKGVRERDGATVQRIVDDPGSVAINSRDRATGEGALHIVVARRDLTWLAFLLNKGARPDISDNESTTPLGLAAMLGWIEGAEQLLAHRARVNLANSRGETPLIIAVQRRDLPMVRLLLSQGADPEQTDNIAGYSALDYARRDPRAVAILRLLENPPARQVGPTMGPTQ